MNNNKGKTKAKNNNPKSFINRKGKLSLKNATVKVDYSKAAIEGIYFPPEFYPSSYIIAQFNMTQEEINSFPFLVTYWFLVFEEFNSKEHPLRIVKLAYNQALHTVENNKDILGVPGIAKTAKEELLKRLDFLTNLEKVPSN